MLDILLPQVQKLISEKTINAFKKGGVKTVATGLYTLLPSYVRLMIKEKAFVDFCITHQERIFGKAIPAKKNVKKIASKKLPAKKIIKKVTIKKGK